MKFMSSHTKKDLEQIKGALRTAFRRSELRQEVLRSAIVFHSDPSRPKVKTWCKCHECGKPEAKSYMQVDHIKPVVPLNKRAEDMTVQELADGVYCARGNLQVLCKECHYAKSGAERKIRAQYRKARKAYDK